MLLQVRRILAELKPYKGTLFIIGFSGVAMAIAQSQLAIQLKDLFDALETKDGKVILEIPKTLLMIVGSMVAARYIHLSNMNYLADLVTMNLRRKLQRKFVELSLSFHSQFQSGSGGLISRILSDIGTVQHGLRLVADFFTQPLSFTLLLGVLFYRDWKLTLGILLFLPVIVLFSKQIGRSLRKYGHSSQQILERVATVVKESLDGMRVIQSFRLENEMAKRFDQAADDFLAARKSIHRRAELASPVTEFIATLVVLIIFVYIGMRISKGDATFGDFGSYLGALLMLQQPVKKLQESFVKIQETLVAVERVFHILDDERKVPEAKAPRAFPENWKEVEYRNVSFAYQNEKVLHNVCFKIQRGEIVALVGESGSGKSTIVNLLERFFDPTDGQILIDGIDVRDFALADLRKHIALVTQDVFLFSDSIEKNIQAGDLSKPLEGVRAAALAANADEFIMRMPRGYQSPVGDRGGLLSGGEKQRVSIARAVFKDAPILILDEATSALDSASELEVQKGLDHLMEGRTSIVIAHRLSTVLHANKILVMKKGRVVEMGTHQDLLANKSEYARFIELQNLH